MELNEKTIHETVKNAEKIFQDIGGTLDSMLRPPNDLRPAKRGICVCLGVGTLGVCILAYLHAPWYAFLAEVCLVIFATITLILTRER